MLADNLNRYGSKNVQHLDPQLVAHYVEQLGVAMEHLLTFLPQEVIDHCNLAQKKEPVEEMRTPAKRKSVLSEMVESESLEEEDKTETAQQSSVESLPPLAKSKSLFTEMTGQYGSML